MKRYKFIHLWLWMAMLLINMSCTNKEDIWKTQEASVKGLAVSFDTNNGEFTRAEELSDLTLKEALVDHADIFIFDGETGALIEQCYWHLTSTDMEENQTRSKTLLDGDWKTTVLSGSDYDVYVVANLHTTPDLGSIQSVNELQTVIEKDDEVYKVYNEKTNSNKFFTMIGKVEGFNPQSSDIEEEYVLPVELKRLAAKIEINIKFSDDFAEQYSSTNIEQRLRNYGVNAPLFEEDDVTFVAERASMSGYEGVYEYNAKTNTAKLILYTYPTEWGTDMIHETFVAVNIPVIDMTKPENDPGRHLNTNYYKISLRGVNNEKRLERNHLYRVNAVINMLGSYIPDEPVQLSTIDYEALDWKNVPVNIDGGSPHYLSVNENIIIMKDVEDYNDLLKFTSSDEIECKLIKAYYYDAEGNEQDVSQQIRNQIRLSPDNGLSGFIDVHSPTPMNNGIRYIKFTVSNGYATEEILVKQYPLEYITFVDGWFSYRDDFKRNNSKPTTYLYAGDKIVDTGGRNPTFQSKVWYNNSIKTYSWGDWGVTTSSYSAGTHNNKMYHVVITKTSDDYTLAIPTKDDNGDTNDTDPANTQNVSPSFMLASRLGLVKSDDYAFAKEHCRNYVETVRDGNTDKVLYSYDDWRLPTKAELMIIDRFQNTDGSVIITILNKSSRDNAYYWGAGGRYRTNYSGKVYPNDSQWTSNTSNNTAYIRCIRDVKVDEPVNSEPEE